MRVMMEMSFLHIELTWESLIDAIKEDFYPIIKYDDQYTRWETLRQERERQGGVRVYQYRPYLALKARYQRL